MNAKKMSLTLVAALALGACASSPVVNAPAGDSELAREFEGAPKWVVSNCSKYLGDKKAVCAVGSVKGTRNPTLARNAAEADARTRIATDLNTRVTGMVKRYAASTVGGAEFKASSDEQRIEEAAKQITNTSLSGTETDETWISKTGTFYVLVVLDIEKFKDTVSSMKELSDTLKQEIAKNAEKSFTELDAATGTAHP